MDFLQFLEPWMIPIVIMICVTIIVAVSVIGNIITTSMKRKDGKSLSENQEFINALREFKENIEQRVSDLEEMVVNESKKRPATLKSGPEKERGNGAIQLEFDDEEPQEKKTSGSSKLPNMLNQ